MSQSIQATVFSCKSSKKLLIQYTRIYEALQDNYTLIADTKLSDFSERLSGLAVRFNIVVARREAQEARPPI